MNYLTFDAGVRIVGSALFPHFFTPFSTHMHV